MVNRIRQRLVAKFGSAPHSSADTSQLWAAFDALALELRDLNATTTNGYRASADAIRAELDHAIADTEGRRLAFEEHVRIWLPESVDAAREHLEVRIDESVDAATAALRTRLRRLELAPPAAAATSAPAASAVTDAPTPIATPTPAGFGLNYSAFEDELRGSPAHVRQLEAVHVDTIAGFGATDLPILDVGCGRGELIQLLVERGLPARGVELNPVSVAECVDLGLDVVAGDAVEYLRSLPAGSLRAVCALHVVEHLSDDDRTALITAAYAALAEGGGIILETPNPENLRVGATTFWLDPTHLRPVPPKLLEFQVAEVGFEQVEIQRLHPSDDAVTIPDDADPLAVELAALLNRLIAGPMDYAVIGRKTAS